MKLEVEADDEILRQLKARLDQEPRVDDVSLRGDADDDQMDLVELTLQGFDEPRTAAEVADQAGLPRDVTLTALGRLEEQDMAKELDHGLWTDQ